MVYRVSSGTTKATYISISEKKRAGGNGVPGLNDHSSRAVGQQLLVPLAP